jgi:hypothetical protein
MGLRGLGVCCRSDGADKHFEKENRPENIRSVRAAGRIAQQHPAWILWLEVMVRRHTYISIDHQREQGAQ